MQFFIYEALSSRVIFGARALTRIADEAQRLGLKRVLVLATPRQQEQAKHLARALGDRAAGVFTGAKMHTPVEITDQAMRRVAELGVDGVAAIGGGSTIGLGKAIALRTDLPQIVAPTTYAGSEMTPILGETKDGRKVTQRSLKVLPEVVIYDVDLTISLPTAMSVTSGLNAIAHAVEALYAQDRNPVISLMAEEGIAAMARALPRIVETPESAEARSDALYGAWLCGACLGAVGMALHHKLCHVLGGTFNLPHAETHAIILPHALAYNAASAPDAIVRIARALDMPEPARGLFAFAGRLGARRALRDIGMPENGIDLAATLATQTPYPNPRPIEYDAIRDLIGRAWAGKPAAA